MHPFRAFIEQYHPISDEVWQEAESYLERMEATPGTLLVKEGKTCKHLFFLEQGLLRFFVWRKGVDVTKFFTVAPYSFTSLQSFSNQEPALENVDALEDSVIWRMKREDAYRLLERPEWAVFVRELTQQVQGYTENILEALQNQTAEERYRNLLENQGDLLQRVPLKYLASYLGITPQSLSRIRKKVVLDR